MQVGDGDVHAGGGSDEHRVQVRGARAGLACTLRDRLRGLLREGAGDGVLVLAPCADIHTFGMRRDIDIAFVGRDGAVLASERAVGPCRRVKCRGASVVLERFACSEAWPKRGDSVRFAVEFVKGNAFDERGTA
ncbi:MAG: DUF192 domain-containing protein [Coriobacteriaceae bacterium]|nr:DUF192 domain-containing protein [Coriobacteriaceae bacterium]